MIWRTGLGRIWGTGVLAGLLCGAATGYAQAPDAKGLVQTMLAREASAPRSYYSYLLNERSDRTGGKLWTERVVEFPGGRVRFLLAEDGQPVSASRMQLERDRLANDVAHPEAFNKREQTQKDDDLRAGHMLELLPRGFFLENVKELNGDWRIDFRPNPDFSPSGSEEHVLHGMSGWMLINQKDMRLHYIEGRLPQDVSLYGFLASVKAGSHFETTKLRVDGNWRTTKVQTDIRGKAAFLASLSRSQDVVRTEYHQVGKDMTLAQAVALVEK